VRRQSACRVKVPIRPDRALFYSLNLFARWACGRALDWRESTRVPVVSMSNRVLFPSGSTMHMPARLRAPLVAASCTDAGSFQGSLTAPAGADSRFAAPMQTTIDSFPYLQQSA
jgi:hypothetical protein